MKTSTTVFLIFIISIFSTNAQIRTLELGDEIPLVSLKMTSVDENRYSIQDIKKENGVLVIFSCNTCPFVLAWENRYPEIFKIALENKIGMGLVNSNYMKRTGDDSFEEMKKHAELKKYSFPYLFDDESTLANAYGAQTTPHVFLFDKPNKLVYIGAIDDNHKDTTNVSKAFLKDALLAIGSGNEIMVKKSRATGCSIKRKAE